MYRTLITILLLVAAQSVSAAPGHLDGYVPSAAHAAGRFGSFWTTDVWIYQQGTSRIHLWFNPIGQDNTNTESVVLDLTENTTVIHDVVASVFGAEGVGSIHYLADGPVTITSRTWTADPGGGSYGQTIPGVAIGQSATPGTGQAGALRMVVDQQQGFRSNLGLVNPSQVTTTVLVEIFLSDGDPADGYSSFQVELAGFGMTQINDVLGPLEPGQHTGLIIRTSVVSDEGALMSYLSTVDNSTNDASYQEGFRFGY